MMMSPGDETETSLEDDLKAAFAQANEAEEQPVTEAVTEEPAEETPAEKSTRERDENGRFKPKGESVEAEAAPVPTGEAEPAAILPDPYGLAPEMAGQTVKDKWKEMSPELRQEYHEREKMYHRELTRQGADRHFGREMMEAFEPYNGFIKSIGASPKQAVTYLLNADHKLRTGTTEQKQAMLNQLVREYGIPMSSQTSPQEGQTSATFDPRVETLAQEIARLKSEGETDKQRVRDEEQRTLQATIDGFASRPENVYFERVKPVMAVLLQNGQADSLEKAYEMAVYADPETRALHLAANQASEDRKRTTAAAEQAAKARRASPSVTGAPGSAVPASQLNGASNSVEDDIRAAIQSVAGRA